MSVKPSSWYQAVMTDMARYGRSPYKERNQRLAIMVKQADPKKVFEFAGSGGHLAKEILDTVQGITLYHHSDFADVAVTYARNLLKQYLNCEISKIDIDASYKNVNWSFYDCFVTTSLEHLEHDLEIIGKMPSNSKFLFSVPDFPSADHIRVFKNREAVVERYESRLLFLEVERIPHVYGTWKYISSTVKR